MSSFLHCYDYYRPHRYLKKTLDVERNPLGESPSSNSDPAIGDGLNARRPTTLSITSAPQGGTSDDVLKVEDMLKRMLQLLLPLIKGCKKMSSVS